jgi:hypothetical protein
MIRKSNTTQYNIDGYWRISWSRKVPKFGEQIKQKRYNYALVNLDEDWKTI